MTARPDSTRSDRTVRGRPDLREDRAIAGLLSAAERAIRRRPRRLHLDFTDTHDADSRALACIVRIVDLARGAGVIVEIRTSPEIERWLDLCRLRNVISGPETSGA
jgi:anti-anti-sigma regulatory factor